MSVIFQLFCAEDLKQLEPEQINELKRIVGDEVRKSQDPSLEASLQTSKIIQERHMRTLLHPGRARSGRARSSSSPPASPPTSMRISPDRVIQIPEEARDTLRKRAREVFHQLTSEQPSGPSGSLAASSELPNQLLSPADLAKLEDNEKEILAWALTCELANFKTYEALQHLKQIVEEKFMDFMEANRKGRQRPKGPDSLYSPFYPLSPLYDPDRSRPNP
jgi:hypothetical protein